jgi:hypothetical protein
MKIYVAVEETNRFDEPTQRIVVGAFTTVDEAEDYFHKDFIPTDPKKGHQFSHHTTWKNNILAGESDRHVLIEIELRGQGYVQTLPISTVTLEDIHNRIRELSQKIDEKERPVQLKVQFPPALPVNPDVFKVTSEPMWDRDAGRHVFENNYAIADHPERRLVNPSVLEEKPWVGEK